MQTCHIYLMDSGGHVTGRRNSYNVPTSNEPSKWPSYS